jgi:hypothetical protein
MTCPHVIGWLLCLVIDQQPSKAMMCFFIILLLTQFTILNKKKMPYHMFRPSHASSPASILPLMPTVG